MQKLAVYTFVLLMSAAVASQAKVNANSSYSIVKETPVKTACIKNPLAADANKFFSTTTNLQFEVFKPGTKADYIAMIDKLKAIDGVQNCIPGNITGDYYAIILTLKTTKDKAWFVSAFKEAGIEHVKINAAEAVSVDKL
jgi:hypothetical protein